MTAVSDRVECFPPGFFDRADPTVDADFYAPPRLVTHIDDGAIAAVGALYEELGIDGSVLDLMGSWVSHFREPPAQLTVLGMNADELAANPHGERDAWSTTSTATRACRSTTAAFDAAVCCVSVDYLTRPVEVFADVARVVRPGGPFVCTFSNRCFPTKAIRGWLPTTDEQHCEIVADVLPPRRAAGASPAIERRTPPRIAAIRCSRSGRSASGLPSGRWMTPPLMGIALEEAAAAPHTATYPSVPSSWSTEGDRSTAQRAGTLGRPDGTRRTARRPRRRRGGRPRMATGERDRRGDARTLRYVCGRPDRGPRRAAWCSARTTRRRARAARSTTCVPTRG